jgi:hypothetical protein
LEDFDHQKLSAAVCIPADLLIALLAVFKLLTVVQVAPSYSSVAVEFQVDLV